MSILHRFKKYTYPTIFFYTILYVFIYYILYILYRYIIYSESFTIYIVLFKIHIFIIFIFLLKLSKVRFKYLNNRSSIFHLTVFSRVLIRRYSLIYFAAKTQRNFFYILYFLLNLKKMYISCI